MIYFIILLLLSYLIGSFPTAIISGKITRGIDIREYGSKNAGATNVFRVLGWKPAVVVMIIDVLKGWFASAFIATKLFQDLPIPDIATVQILCGFAAVLGHTYTIFGGFKGGKGVGTLAGMLLALFPIAFPLCLLVFVIALITTGIVSICSISAAISLPIFLYLIPLLTNIESATRSLQIFSILIPLFVLYTHRSNIKRLREGTENQFEKVMLFRKKKRAED